MTSLPHVKRPCKECPFRKDSLKGWLGDTRMREILASDSFVCHKKLYKQCAGHMLIKGLDNVFVQVATRLGLPLKLTGKDLVFDTTEQCIEHHRN